MPTTVLHGRVSHKARSLITLWWTATGVLARRIVRRPRVKEWDAGYEIGTVFFRRQFNHAFALNDIVQGRAYFDSLFSVVEPSPAVDAHSSRPGHPPGTWFVPRGSTSSLTMLYFHGGGYAFDAAVTRHFVAMLAGWTGIRIFAPSYRLTPEHPHPAQLDDAIAAYRWLLAEGAVHDKLIVCGDSAGGHLALMTLSALLEERMPQPAICVALSPWTDIGERGASQFGHDRYDMVQGYQTMQFGSWLRGNTDFPPSQLSPIYRDFRGAAPVYLQAGGKEILVDMIRDFADVLVEQGTPVRLDVWTHMVHEFHGYGNTRPESREAIQCIRDIIEWATAGATESAPPAGDRTEIDQLRPLTTDPSQPPERTTGATPNDGGLPS